MHVLPVPVIDPLQTGDNITQLRERAGITVKQLQEVFGFATPQAIYKWQRGATIPSIDNLIILSDLFHITIEDILVIRRVAG